MTCPHHQVKPRCTPRPGVKGPGRAGGDPLPRRSSLALLSASMRQLRLVTLSFLALSACAHSPDPAPEPAPSAESPPPAPAQPAPQRPEPKPQARALPKDEPRLWDLAGMDRIKARITAKDGALTAVAKRIKREGDEALAAGPLSVMQKRLIPQSGDKHDYLSIAPYWWPDPTKPRGMPYVQRDGEHNPDRASDDTDADHESQMADAVRALSLAYFLTDDEAYARHAALLLRTWFLD